MNIKIGILGYGNIGRGVETALRDNPDMELAAVFTRRDPSQVKILSENVPVISVSEIEAWKDKIDVLLLCGGSATDLPQQTPFYAKMFNVVDTFDTHARVPAHFAAVDRSAKENGKIAIISVGWDPGLFSLSRLYGNVILPDGRDYTFWGKGVSQGHSDAIRRIKGVKNAKQYTCPVESAMRAVRNGESLPQERNISVNVSSFWKMALTRHMWKNKSRRCRTILPTIILWFISFRKKNLIGTIRGWRMAVSFSAVEIRGKRKNISISLNSV